MISLLTFPIQITASVQRKEQTNPFLDAPGQPKRQAGPLLDVPEPPYKQTDPLPASAWQLKANPRGVEKVFQFGNFNEVEGPRDYRTPSNKF